MEFPGYGLLALLPREIRDQIYEEYFAASRSIILDRYNEVHNAAFTIYAARADMSLMRVSRALYRETRPYWQKSYFSRFSLFRVTIELKNKRKIETAIVRPPAKRPPVPYYRWMQTRFPSAAQGKCTRCIRLVFPDFKCLLNPSTSRNLEGFGTILAKHRLRHITDLIVIIQDATWPLPIAGEYVWFKRLHQGMTRRSLIKTREDQAQKIATELSTLLNKWSCFADNASFNFGDSFDGRQIDKVKDFGGIVSMIEKTAKNLVIPVN